MPGGDRTGPMGAGAMTGRRAGFCAGYPVPGYANVAFGGQMGTGGGMGRGFRGGRGRRWATLNPVPVMQYPQTQDHLTADPPELSLLQAQLKNLETALSDIQDRIAGLSQDNTEK